MKRRRESQNEVQSSQIAAYLGRWAASSIGGGITSSLSAGVRCLDIGKLSVRQHCEVVGKVLRC